MRSGFFSTRGAAAIIALAITLMGFLLGVRIFTAHVSDQKVAEREQALVRNGLAGLVAETASRVVGQTTWDDSVRNLGLRYDAAWTRKNIGRYLHDMSGFERTYVLNGVDQPIYAMAFGSDTALSSLAALRADAAPLVARVRHAETVRRQASSTMAPPIQASAFMLVGGVPNIVTATLVQPDFGKFPLPGRAPVVVTYEVMDTELLNRFSHRFLLGDLRPRPAASPTPPGRVSVALADVARREILRLDWTPQSPGRLLLRRSLPVVIIAMVAFCAIVTALFLRGRQAVRSLVASESLSKHMAYHDPLTGLPNRAMFQLRIDQALADLRRGGPPVGVLALDLDRFKLINDTYGHGAGDALIVDVATRLTSLARTSDTIIRLGGDEFVVLYTGATPSGLASLAARIVELLAAPVDLPFARVFAGVSVGVTLIDDPEIDGEEALRQADLAMYRAKDGGRGRFEFFEPEMDLALKARRLFEDDLRTALSDGALSMVYQPQVDGRGRMVGVEALARWTHPVRGPISPSVFIPIAEDCGLIEAIGEFTLRQAFIDSLNWPELTVAVNVSARQLRNGGFPQRIAALLQATGADARRLELEITEGVLLEDDATTHATLSHLRRLGFTLALDDFGTGYSSLSYLRRYPVDKIKIDRSFVISLGAERESEAVVSAIVKLARALHLKVIAEGVETEAQRDSLRRAGCWDYQGFYFSQPIPAGEVAGFEPTDRPPLGAVA